MLTLAKCNLCSPLYQEGFKGYARIFRLCESTLQQPRDTSGAGIAEGMASSNSSSGFSVVFNELDSNTLFHPSFYYCARPSLLPYLSDHHLSLFLPIVAYWAYSLVFCILDSLCPYVAWLERHRIHESPQVKARNLTSPQKVVWSVVVQQANQTVLGLLTLDSTGGGRNIPADMHRLRTWISFMAAAIFGEKTAESMLKPLEADLTWLLYWWGIPVVQFIAAQYVCCTISFETRN